MCIVVYVEICSKNNDGFFLFSKKKPTKYGKFMYGGEGLRLSVTTIPSSFYVKVHSGSDSNLVFARVSWTKTRQIISIKRRTLSKILCYEYLCNDPGLIEIEIFYNGEVMTRRSVRVLSRNVVVIRTSH